MRHRNLAAVLPGGGTPAQAGQPTASAVKTAAIFTKVGIALSADTFSSTGKQVADVTAVRLADGRVRLYAFVAPDGIRSAISTDGTGTRFVAEPGRRITWAPGGQTRAYKLSDGRVRLFYLDGGSIKSRSRSDGLSFTDEGVRITTAAAGFEPGGLSIVKVGSGYRGYFSNLEKPGDTANAGRPYRHLAGHADVESRAIHRRRIRLDQEGRVASVRDLQREDDRPLLQRRPWAPSTGRCARPAPTA